MNCLDDNLIVAYLEGSIDLALRADIETHLDSCRACLDMIAAMASVSYSSQHSKEALNHSIDNNAAHSPQAQLANLKQRWALTVGSHVAQFEIVRPLGRGGIGEVYLARDLELGRKVALKLISTEENQVATKERLLAEARATAQFNHPHIVVIYAVGEFQGKPYLALEYVEGETLRLRLTHEHLSIRQAVRYALAIAAVLEEAHRREILHRDLKPENILLGRDGRLRVADFGLALPINTRDLTASTQGTISGTPAYMAPEQWTTKPCSTATDIWALGIILYEMLSGHRPYAAKSIKQLRDLVTDDHPAPRITERDDLPAELLAITYRCLEKDPSQRPTATEVTSTLNTLLHSQTETTELLSDDGPFCGLLPFSETKSALYFGREREIAEFIERLRTHCLLPIVGPSGAGKSSFVFAGIIPRLREQHDLTVVEFRPGNRPFINLANAFITHELTARDTERLLSTQSSAPHHISVISHHSVDLDPRLHTPHDTLDETEIARLIQESPHRLGLLLRRLAAELKSQVLLFVDQLEELYSLVPDEALRSAFMRAIISAADDERDPVRVIFTVRDDFLVRLTADLGIGSAITQWTMLSRPSSTAMREMLIQPVTRAGYRFEDPALVEDMVAEIQHEATALPLLQFAADQLWRRRDRQQRLLTRSSYEQMGGIIGALARHADSVIDTLAPEEQQTARDLLLRLVTPEGTRRELTKEELLKGSETAGEIILNQLITARLLVVRSDETNEYTTQSYVELTHESLIHTWRRLTRWIDESREQLTALADIRQAAELWRKRGSLENELWQGRALETALAIAKHHREHLSTHDWNFLVQGEQLAQRARKSRRRRRRFSIGILFAVTCLSIAIAAQFYRQRQEIDHQRSVAQRGKAQAEQLRSDAEREGAKTALTLGKFLEARAKIRSALETTDSLAGRALWWQLSQEPSVWKTTLSTGTPQIVYDPRQKRLIVGQNTGHILFLDEETGGVQKQFRAHEVSIPAIAIASDGTLLVSGTTKGQVRIWNPKTHALLRTIEAHPQAITALDISPDGTLLLTGSFDRTIKLWDLKTGALLKTLVGHSSDITRVKFSPDGKRVASASNDHTLRLWSVASGTTTSELKHHRGMVMSLAFNAEGTWLASGSADRTIAIWNTADGTRLHTLHGHQDAVMDLVFSTKHELLSISVDKTIRAWDITQHRERWHINAGTRLTQLVLAARDTWFATLDQTLTVTRWRRPRSSFTDVMDGHKNAVMGVDFSPDGHSLATGSHDKTVRIWDVTTGRSKLELGEHVNTVTSVRYSPDGTLLAAASGNFVQLWNPSSGAKGITLSGHQGSIWGLSFSPNGEFLASGSHDKTIGIWSVKTGELIRRLRGHEGMLWDVAFSPDGTRLISAAHDATVRVWNAHTGELAMPPIKQEAIVVGLDFGKQSDRFATGAINGKVHLWELQNRRATSQLLGQHHGIVHWLDFAPQGNTVASPADDKVIRIWSLDGKPARIVSGHRSSIAAVRFNPEGTHIASTGGDDTVRLWHAETGRALWSTTTLTSNPPTIHTRQFGWKHLDATGVVPSHTWRDRVAANGNFARDDRNHRALCLLTNESTVEFWDLTTDTRQFTRDVATLPPPTDLFTLKQACAVVSNDQVWLITEGSPPSRLVPRHVTAIEATSQTLWVADLETVRAFNSDGTLVQTLAVNERVTALAQVNQHLVLAYEHGVIELRELRNTPSSINSSSKAHTVTPHRRIQLENASTSMIERMIAGPLGLLILGFTDGDVGMWDPETGNRYASGKLHGPIRYLMLDGNTLYAASELGAYLTWNLSLLQSDYCTLMRHIWNESPISWIQGKPVKQGPPQDHSCAPINPSNVRDT